MNPTGSITEEFGKTIAGFFSDEPELGNGVYFNDEIGMGTDHDFPWSRELGRRRCPQTLGSDWKTLLPLLWDNDTDPKLRAQVRYRYMDLGNTAGGEMLFPTAWRLVRGARSGVYRPHD